jgi:hypothetical protein
VKRRVKRRSPQRRPKAKVTVTGRQTDGPKRPGRNSRKPSQSASRSALAHRKGAQGAQGGVGGSQPPDPIADEVRAAVGHVSNYDPTMIADSFVLTGPPLKLQDFQLSQLKDDLNRYIQQTKPTSSLSDADVQAPGLKVGGLLTKVKSKLKSGKTAPAASGGSTGRARTARGPRK